MATKKKIEKYVKERVGNSIYLGRDMWGNKRIYFRNNQTNKFTGHISQNKESIKLVQKYNSIKVKIRIKRKGVRGKKTIIYNIYNKKQQQIILFRMNKILRTPENKNRFKRYGLKKTYKRDAVPMIIGKRKVDLLFDKYKFEDVDIEKFEGWS